MQSPAPESPSARTPAGATIRGDDESQIAYVGLGANLGYRQSTIRSAIEALGRLRGTRLLRTSSLFRSEPVDADGPDYLNAVVAIDTLLGPLELLAELQHIEAVHGRERPYPNAPRNLDLDLLLHGASRLQGAVLTLPHPRLHERAFVLLPLAEIEPELVLPGLGPISGLLPRVAAQRIEKCPS
jgi:2-amino-4-hydroxy-6-hydroxymethyldihydropteridine diphosphokinase